jgi:hypothetical protein
VFQGGEGRGAAAGTGAVDAGSAAVHVDGVCLPGYRGGLAYDDEARVWRGSCRRMSRPWQHHG